MYKEMKRRIKALEMVVMEVSFKSKKPNKQQSKMNKLHYFIIKEKDGEYYLCNPYIKAKELYIMEKNIQVGQDITTLLTGFLAT